MFGTRGLPLRPERGRLRGITICLLRLCWIRVYGEERGSKSLRDEGLQQLRLTHDDL